MEAAEPVVALEREERFRELVEEHSRMVFRVAFRMTGSAEDAEDVVQETFLRAYRNAAAFDSRAAVSTWLFRIATNCAIDLLRGRKRRRSDSERADAEVAAAGSPDPSPESAAFGGQIQARVAAALSDLTPKERAAFVLRHFEGKPIEEIARALGVRSNAAKQTIFRAVRKLRARLEPLVEPGR